MQYVKECLQLLYWIYFKPYTLKQHVQEICPEITKPYDDNIYRRSVEAKANPRLKRYDDQIWWLTALVPILVVAFCGALTATAGLHFNWWVSSFFLFGWLLGQLLVRAVRRKLGEETDLLLLLATLGLLIASACLIEHFVTDSLRREAALGVAGGMALGVAGGMALVSFVLGVLRICFWLPELLWTLCLKLAPVPPASRLRFLPPQFDQLIILPLPFLPGLIAEAYRENQAAARQSINYLISSTNQQKTAGRAILLIVSNECSRCRTAHDIAALRSQLDWLPADLAGQFNACLELSTDTAAALEASSPFRQEQRLELVCKKIISQRNDLVASASKSTAFGRVIDHWLRILETACRTLHEPAKRSEEIPQVYLAGPALDPNRAGRLFKGRRDLFRQIESLILSTPPPTLVMQGNRRTGKSSTLRYLPKQMPSDVLPLFVDCQGAAVSSTLAGFAMEFADQLIRSARQSHHLHLPPPDKAELLLDPFAALLGWLDTVEQAAVGKTLLLCLDEFERIEEIITAAGSRAPLNFLRHLIQHRSRWQLLFAGAHTPEELASYWSDYLINSRSLRISFLDRDDAMELIRTPVEDFPDIWDEAAAEAVWQLTAGQPYLTQLLCQEAVDHLNRKKAKTVLVSDVEEILPAAFEHGHYYFDEFWRELKEEQRQLLAALAQGEPVPPELAGAVPLLLRKEVLVQENSGYAFRAPLLGRWVQGGRGNS